MTIKDPHAAREAEKYEKPIASRELLLELIEKSHTPPSFNEVCKKLNYQDDNQIIAVKRRLRAMENSGQIIFNKFKQYALPPKNSVLTGKVIGHRDGFGFFVIDVAKGEPKTKDLYISSHEMQRVFHGDIVEAILVDRTDRKGRKEVKILDVIEPRKNGIVGRYYVENKVSFIKPDDAKIQQDIIIPPKENLGARHGEMVVVEVIQRPTKRSSAIGKVIEVLGEHLAPGMEIEIALREHDLPHTFPPAVIAEVAILDNEVPESAKTPRIDLRKLPLVTIDGEDARDFDDAVYCQPNDAGGWSLWVAIADVSYYVRPESALDDEAISRGTSVYFPSQVIPMLPEKLSNGLCSLNPHVDRLCMVCEMTVSAEGQLSSSKFYPAVMNSHARFTYTKVAAILAGDEVLRAEYAAQVPDLENLNKMYLVLAQARDQRGAIAFETEESRFIFNENKKIESIVPLIRNDAHKIIEECMILANVATANFVLAHKMPGLYRAHDKPGEEKYRNFVTYLAELGIKLPFTDEPSPKDYSHILALVADRPDKELIQTMLLRSMRQAVYQSECIGHFGLALEAYSHFTSPIRRYPDLVIHRVIKAILEGQENNPANEGCYSYPEEAVVELGEHCSMTERRADDATRDVADWLKCEFMQDHIGDSFSGVISTVTNFGMFIRLSDLHIEGLVHITSLGRDYYHFDDVRMCLTGEHTGTKYRVGDVVEVQVAAVNLDEKKIDLVLAGSALQPRDEKGFKSAQAKPSKTGEAGKATSAKTKAGVSAKNSPTSKKEKAGKAKPKKAKVRKSRPGKNERLKAKKQ